MGLGRQFQSLALVLFLVVSFINSSHSRHLSIKRHKRQHGADLYLPGSYVIPGGEGDPNEHWGPWGSPSECSRSCGGGVAYQTRECYDVGHDGSPRCRGSDKKFFSCNTQDCPETDVDFRQQQCSHFDNVPFEGVRYEWVPYLKAPNPCELNCMPRGERFYYRHKAKVIDGTRCNEESLDVCVDGTCQSVGCDMMLGSSSKEDKCRKCAGDGSSCKTVEGLLDMDNLQVGYNDILLIPAGATNIEIKEIAPSNNYLAIRNLLAHYYLNGNWRIDFPRPMNYAGGIWHYERKPQGFAAPDHLTCMGPTTEPLYLVLLYQDRNVGIHYEYSVPEGSARLREPDSYDWTFGPYSECSAKCGGGFQIRNVTCNSRTTLEQVDESLCDSTKKMEEVKKCGQDKCPPRWVESPWGKCSAPCGNEGKQERDVTCEQVSAFGVVTKVKDSICLDSVGNKPATVQECNVGIVCPQWHIGSWQPCNKLCGPGSQKRQVKCYRKVDGKITVLDDADCVEVRPESTKECIQRPCEGVDWITSPWTGCKSCGLTAESRTVLCASKDGKVYNETFCANRKLPELERPCTSTTACKYQWFTSQWSKCSAECGKGVQTRTIVCGLFDGEFVKRADDESKCEVKEKPNEQRDCSAEKECPGQWFTGPWSECSVPCGGGRKTRKVLCLANNKAVPVTECTEEAVIFSSEDCNPDPCVDDETIPVDSTSKPILEDDEGEEYCDEDEEEDGEELDKMNSTGDDGSGSTSDAFDLNVRTTHSMLITDELMQSDATGYESDIAVSESATDLPTPTTVEGSGDDDISIHERFNLEEGSGEPHELKDIAQTPVPGAADDDYEDENGEEDEDEDEYSTASTESSTSDSTTDTTESTSTDTTDTTESSSSISTDTTESSSSISTDTTESSSSFATDTTESSSSLATDTTESSTSISTETTESSSSVSTESTESSSSVSTDTTESSSSVSTDTTESSTSVSTDTTESSSSVSTDTTESSSSISTETTESSSSVSTDTTESSSSVSTETTESSSSVSTDTTEFSSSISTDTTESSSSISTDTTESSSSVSTDTTESSSSISTDTTESSSSISTETTESSTPISTETTESSTPISTETTESSSSISTETTESSSPISTETTESSSTISTETTESSSSISTETTESSSPISTETTESLSSISTETTESSSSISTETTESSSSIATETTESSSSISTETTESSSSISTETTESSSSISTETTESSSSISTETTESTSSASTETTESPATDTTETGTEEIESRFGVTEVDVDIWSTTSGSEATEGSTSYTLEDVIRKETTPRKCKPRPKKPVCLKSPFGCCADNVTSAKGPFDEGCPSPKTCKETKHGCCPDKVSPAKGPKNKGCPKPLCDEGLFGCCPDGITEAEGEDEEGCPIIVTTTTAGGCEAGKYGCCPDGESEATGPNNEGCEEGSTTECEGEACIFTTTSESTSEETETEESVSETTTEAEDKGCARSTYGCCPDGVSEATGENYHGCEEECESSPHGCCADRRTPAKGPNMEGCSECLSDIFGCCRDGKTPAHGPNGEGCCLQSAFGCCPDNLNEAQGPNLEGCGCEYSSYGCCPDNKTIAKGHDNLGCGCELTKFGCCLDKVTPAPDENLKGCPCHTFQFGCCPDGITVPSGPHNYGCHCSHSEFKCCSDEVTPATGPNYEGCSCATSKFGCCPDGVTEAQGKNFDDCRDVPTVPQKACSLKRDGGTCNNFTVKSFYDTEYGGCSRFWYGGCDGNDNRFETIDECKAVCEDPVGKDACLLPKVHGPCTGYSPMWYFDNDRNQCTQFIYGGCLGNNNRFETLEDCKNICVPDESIPACEQPVDEGPCQGSYERWYFDIDSDLCRPFNYGGCKGNKNNYQTEHACNYNCKTPGVQRESCTLPESKGECEHVQARWFFSNKDNKCMPFYYSGCGGNHNKYYTEEECERSCPVLVERDLCALPAEVGDCQNYTARWYFDTRESRCRQFYYGGCGGNKNNFNHEDDCLSRCEKKEEVQPEEPVRPEEPRTPEEPERFSTDFCFLPSHQGDCNSYEGRWYYNSYEGVCEQFTYTGCGGNQNNFPTYDECEQHCGSVQETCSLPPVRGHCNENIQRWYYDERSDRCHQFDYGGCRGNTNNFYTERDCLNACKVSPPTDERTHAPPHVEPPRHEVSICDEPLDHGDCDADEVKYFYNRETASCEGFEYTGCGGNGNRFESLEQCDRQCGEYRGVDVCNQPVEIGPCDQYQVRYYYNSESRRCLAFHYSGCEGTGNRFTSMDECESICITHEEPVVDNKAICFLPAETGNCSTYQDFHRRYFYDDSRGTCMPFIYSGCAGNQNNFRSFDSCIAFCHQEPEPEPEPEQPTEYHHTPEPPVAHSPRPTDHCRSYNEACDNLYCNYGIESSYTEDGCMICTCEDPCSKVSCPRYAQCSVEIAYDLDKETGFVGVCVDKNKPGECPRLRNNTLCERECETDADCRGEKKCCVAGCGFVCVLPEVPESTQAPVEQPRPYPHHPGAIAPTLEERLPEDINIDAHEGGYAVLRCYATGYPPPTVTWQRGAIVLNTNQGRYFVTSNGDLQIVQLHRTDSGIYVCIADNGVGAPVSRTVELEVRDPVELDGNAYILGEPNATIIATLKQPITLRCLAGGYPKPYVSWWRGNDLLPLISPHFEFGRDYSLILKQVELSDLGRYTCQAYTGRGRPVSITITLNALGPVHAKNKDDEKYLEFVVNPPVAPTHTPETPYIPRPLHPVVVPVEEEKIPASARLRLPGGNVYNPGSEIVIECETDGYPLPNVTWYKNNREIVESKHVQLLDSHRLSIYGAKSEDSGYYKCEARNHHSHSSHEERIEIEGVEVPPDCVDNQHYADCGKIVKGRYCGNPYYFRFCCRSCTLDGQAGPNLVL